MGPNVEVESKQSSVVTGSLQKEIPFSNPRYSALTKLTPIGFLTTRGGYCFGLITEKCLVRGGDNLKLGSRVQVEDAIVRDDGQRSLKINI